MNDKRLATLHELQTVYNTEDCYKFLELLDMEEFIDEERSREFNRQQAIINAANNNRR